MHWVEVYIRCTTECICAHSFGRNCLCMPKMAGKLLQGIRERGFAVQAITPAAQAGLVPALRSWATHGAFRFPPIIENPKPMAEWPPEYRTSYDTLMGLAVGAFTDVLADLEVPGTMLHTSVCHCVQMHVYGCIYLCIHIHIYTHLYIHVNIVCTYMHTIHSSTYQHTSTQQSEGLPPRLRAFRTCVMDGLLGSVGKSHFDTSFINFFNYRHGFLGPHRSPSFAEIQVSFAEIYVSLVEI